MNRRQQIESKKLNLCARFILPMVGINYKSLPEVFINAYIDMEYGVYLIFEKDEDFERLFENYFSHIKNTNNFLVQYEEDVDEIVFKFKVPKNFEEDYMLFSQGSYSKLSNILKDRLALYFGNKTIKDNHEVTVYNAIHPQEFKRKQIADRLGVNVDDIVEVLDVPNLTDETYTPLTSLLTNKYEQTVH